MFLYCWICREGAENMYYFSSLALTLNEPEEGVAPTDSRRRPDQRLMEEGHWDEANAEKQRLEEKQRSTRREREREAVKAASSPEEGRTTESEFVFSMGLIFFFFVLFVFVLYFCLMLCPFIFYPFLSVLVFLVFPFFFTPPPLLMLSCHWGFDQWLAFEKQVLSLVSSHLWCELQTAQSKVHTRNVCAFSIKVLSILLS